MHIIGSCEFDGWGAWSSSTPGEMEALAAPDAFHFDHIGLALFTHFHLHGQLQAASAYASQHSVVFKGDLPIGVNRYCADTWQYPELFRLHKTCLRNQAHAQVTLTTFAAVVPSTAPPRRIGALSWDFLATSPGYSSQGVGTQWAAF